eukprot:612613-Hanusia_phi.AAC.3
MSQQHNSKIPGRIVIDLQNEIQREHKLRSYSLEAVAKVASSLHIDVVVTSSYAVSTSSIETNPSCMMTTSRVCAELASTRSRAWLSMSCRGTSIAARKLAHSACRATLPLKLISELELLINLVEMARVTGVLINELVQHAQQFKVLSQLCRACKDMEYVIPYKHKERISETEGEGNDGNAASYQGATVLNAKTGSYWSPICTLDFASLYPSIIIAYNLSYETLVRDPKEQANADEPRIRTCEFDISSNNDDQAAGKKFKFIQSWTDADGSEHAGILPCILRRLLKARKDAKLAMQNETDEQMKKILNGRQLAYKISCNSIYGFCGATNGYLPCLPIAATVTAIGRDLINRTRSLIERDFSQQHACAATVVYGDTDSVMIDFQLPGCSSRDVERAMDLGKRAALAVSKTFPAPIKLEFEKVYCPYLLFSKKRYAGLLFSSSPHAPDKIDVKGIETVRRDSCPFVQEVYSECLDIVLKTSPPDVGRAINLVRTRISELLEGRVPLVKLVLCKPVGKDGSKSRAPHLELVRRMSERGRNIAAAGERLQYVQVINSTEKVYRTCDSVEDPAFAIKNELNLDYEVTLLRPAAVLPDEPGSGTSTTSSRIRSSSSSRCRLLAPNDFSG